MLNQLIQFVALFLLMLVTGAFFGPWFSIHRSIKVFNKDEFIKIVKTMAANLAWPMRVMLPLCIIFMVLIVCIYPQKNSAGFYLDVTALILIVISLLVTVLIEVPIVNQIQKWTTEIIPADWEEIRDRWLKFHVIRTFAAIISFMCFTAQILFCK